MLADPQKQRVSFKKTETWILSRIVFVVETLKQAV